MADEVRTVKTDPDPTVAVKEAMNLAIKNLDEKLEQRFTSMEKAVVLAREEVKTANTDLARANQEALKTALDARTETAKKMDAAIEDTNRRVEVLTERVNVWTGQDARANVAKADRGADTQRMISVIMMLVGLAGIILAVVTLVSKGPS